jgi:bidirectional [NiFe] hydrogenase diaphorase subunit
MPQVKVNLEQIASQEHANDEQYPYHLMCCTSTACLSAGARVVREALETSVKAKGLEQQVQVVPVGCMGLCSKGPLVKLKADDHRSTEAHEGHDTPYHSIPETHTGAGSYRVHVGESMLYHSVTPELAEQLVTNNVAAHQPLAENILSPELPFFKRQQRIVLANAGEINPERIEAYIARGGYRSLEKALTTMTPEQVVTEIERSGLRGRGGGGYPTGKKWRMLFEAKAEKKYVVANGDEGDPGAYMDRTVMEDDPHRVIEGVTIAAYAVGASEGYIYVRAEYPIAVKRLEQAIRQAKRQGLLGKNILTTDFSFDLEVRIGAGAFVCGEETALMASIEGKRGNPVLRPPYPTERGLWGYPTMINNVETYANISTIIEKGAAWFSGIGTPSSKGTKVFALAGKLNNTGLIEVPMGITLREIIEDIGGGVKNGQHFKAAQTGGPSGGCIPAAYLDTPVDYESLQALGSIMGSGGLIVMDETDSMVDVAKFFIQFCMEESCGKCVPCRAGTVQMYQLLEKISKGQASSEDLAQLEELCDLVKHTSLCGLGQTAPNPVTSTLRYFRQEYLDLLVGNKTSPKEVNKQVLAASAD